jgi:hypothetical protein
MSLLLALAFTFIKFVIKTKQSLFSILKKRKATMTTKKRHKEDT